MIKVYGPYTRKDGRQIVIHYDTVTKSRRTQSYPRYQLEQQEGRALDPTLEVDHINDNPRDNRIANYQLLSHQENVAKSNREEIYEFICLNCKQESSTLYRRYWHNQVIQKKAGPFCSRACAAKYTHW